MEPTSRENVWYTSVSKMKPIREASSHAVSILDENSTTAGSVAHTCAPTRPPDTRKKGRAWVCRAWGRAHKGALALEPFGTWGPGSTPPPIALQSNTPQAQQLEEIVVMVGWLVVVVVMVVVGWMPHVYPPPHSTYHTGR